MHTSNAPYSFDSSTRSNRESYSCPTYEGTRLRGPAHCVPRLTFVDEGTGKKRAERGCLQRLSGTIPCTRVQRARFAGTTCSRATELCKVSPEPSLGGRGGGTPARLRFRPSRPIPARFTRVVHGALRTAEPAGPRAARAAWASPATAPAPTHGD